MLRRPRFAVLRICIQIALTLTMLLVPAAIGQSQGPAAAEPDLEIDLPALLHMDYVLEGDAAGPVWTFSASEGRRLLKLPVRVQAAAADYELDTMTLRVRGGRFLAWQLCDPEVTPPQGYRGPASSFEILDAIPAEAPRFTRELTVRPDGTIAWQVRRLAGGSVVQNPESLYCLDLDPQLRSATRPEPPPRRPNPGESRAAFLARSAELRAAYDAQMRAYREQEERRRDLPDALVAPLPARIWAIFEINPIIEPISISGPAPLPWEIGYEDLRAVQFLRRPYRADVSPIESVAMLPDFYPPHIARSREIMAASDSHVYSTRMISYALASSGIVGFAQPGDPLYQLLETLVAVGDPASNTALAKELISVIPPTIASRQLLQRIGENLLDSAELQRQKVANLAAMVDLGPVRMKEAVDEVVALVTDEQGLAVAEILEPAAATLDAVPAAASGLALALRSARLPEARRDGVILWAAQRAGEHPSAARLLDEALLGSQDPQTAQRTLAILAGAQRSGLELEPLVGAFLQGVFGDADTSGEAADVLPRAQVTTPIPIASASHNLLTALASGHGATSKLAWQALPLFVITAPAPAGEVEPDVYTMIVDAALAQERTPAGVVDFLTHQQDTARATRGLVRIAGQAPTIDPATGNLSRAVRQACLALVGSGQPLAGDMAELSTEQRHAFARAMYRSVLGYEPPMVGLMRQAQLESLPQWFAEKVASAETRKPPAEVLPDAAAWITAAGGEEAVISLMDATEAEVVRGAVGALIASVGGSPAHAQRTFESFWTSSDRSAAVFRQQWDALKAAMRQQRLARLVAQAQRYQLRIAVVPSGDGDAQSSADSFSASAVSATVDGITLSVADDAIEMNQGAVTFSLPESELALILDRPADLKNLGSEAVARVPFEDVVGPLTLTRDEQGIWRGTCSLSSGDSVSITLSPRE